MENPVKNIKPEAIKNATNLLWAALTSSLAKIILHAHELTVKPPGTAAESAGSTAFMTAVMFITLLLIIFIIFKISEGRNWARLIYLICFLASLPVDIPLILRDFFHSPATSSLSVIQWLLQINALFLLFTRPGRDYFHTSKPKAPPPRPKSYVEY